jgi:hypothetical protein
MFMTHMDTVPLCAGAKPKLVDRKIVNEAKTALGGDNRAGCGVTHRLRVRSDRSTQLASLLSLYLSLKGSLN